MRTNLRRRRRWSGVAWSACECALASLLRLSRCAGPLGRCAHTVLGGHDAEGKATMAITTPVGAKRRLTQVRREADQLVEKVEQLKIKHADARTELVVIEAQLQEIEQAVERMSTDAR